MDGKCARPSVDPIEQTHRNNENEVVQSDMKERRNIDEGATSSGQVKLEAEKKIAQVQVRKEFL